MSDEQTEAASEGLEGLPTIKGHRRLLEVVSLASIAYYWFDIRLNPHSSLMSFPVHIGSTRYVGLALWLALGWAALRYGQQLYRLWNRVRDDVYRDYLAELNKLAHRVVKRYVLGLSPEQRSVNGTAKHTPNRMRATYLSRFDFEEARRFDKDHKEVAPKLPVGLGKDSHTVIATEIEWIDEAKRTGFSTDIALGIGPLRAASLYLSAAIMMALRLPTLLDYVSPLLMLLFAIVSLAHAATGRNVHAVIVDWI